MQQFFLNLTRIVENNARIYLSIIFGIALCLLIFVAEAVHVQKIAESLATKDQNILRAAISPIADIYTWARIVVLILMCVWSRLEYSRTKKRLGL
ncbi:hypothetical protein [uncultured Acinetobacter sp.]|uniref:hypothetical protein n=1 Tax=uncultured Acinetobacter sp. TaxID=165433 RepID=UPI002605FBB8|nr:hypothetical protein [uncultured Acinetobacter sp.]